MIGMGYQQATKLQKTNTLLGFFIVPLGNFHIFLALHVSRDHIIARFSFDKLLACSLDLPL